MHVVAWLLPVVFSFTALGLEAYGPTGMWCWINTPFDWARWAFFYAWLWALMIYTAVCMFFIVKTVRDSDEKTRHLRSDNSANTKGSSKSGRMSKKTRQVAIQGILYVSAFWVTWTFGTINR